MTRETAARARGSVVGSYELVERIGAGGMGEVWKARDRLLDRIVALKFLSAQGSSRHDLLHEARAASSLNHPNIVTVFQIGESDGDSYLAMEFVEGENLRRYLGSSTDLNDALEISEQIVDGLASAHARGIIHRDLKPENIMIRGDGRVKLVDFGLAKRLLTEDGSTAPTKPLASRSGELVGTCSYMSPEQARGHQLSTASDVFSLGIVMYEMFSGRHPFRHQEVLDTLNAIVKHEPPPLASERPDAPPKVSDIVSRSLEKEPSQRYSSAVEISEPLKAARLNWDMDTTRTVRVQSSKQAPAWGRALGGAVIVALLVMSGWSLFRPSSSADATTPLVRSMAVMPFRTADPNAVMMAEALPEDLGSALSRAGFQVASRTGVQQMGASPDARAAAIELGVDAVLDGTLRVQGTSVRIYVELVSARTGFQIWSGTFAADAASLLAGQSTTAGEIASQIRTVAGGQP